MPKPRTTKVGDRQGNAAPASIDRHTHLPLLTAPVRSRDGEEPHPLVRQWRILKLLTYSTKGFTVKELATLSGMSEKTVRRDLIFLRRVGFDMSETVGEHGRKQWRIRQMPESMAVRGSVREKYGLIHDTLGDLHDAALVIGDAGLAVALKHFRSGSRGSAGVIVEVEGTTASTATEGCNQEG